MISEASYVALMSGYVKKTSRKELLSRSVVHYKHSQYDEFRFLRKFFNPMWSIAYLIYSFITFKNIIYTVSAFLKTIHLKRIDGKYKFLIKEKINLEKDFINKINTKRIRIIIPTLNRYESLKNLLKDLEEQTYSNFKITIVDQSENYDREFYKNFNLDIDLQRQKKPALWNARNNAIKSTSEKIITLLDDDSRVNHDWLLNHMKCLHYYDSDISAGISLSQTGAKIPSNYYFYRVSDQIDTGNVTLKREIFNKCGFFDEKFEGMRMGDAEFGLRSYQKGLITISNPEAFRIHHKNSKGGLRQLGSWDTFRPTSFFKPRPIPSALYFSRKYFGDYNSLIFLLINLPISLSVYHKKDNKFFLILSIISFFILFPIILFQALISWNKSSGMLIDDNKTP